LTNVVAVSSSVFLTKEKMFLLNPWNFREDAA